MNRFRRLTALVLALMLGLSLCACGKGEKENLFSESSYQNRSDQVVDDGWTDGIDDRYLFEYEVSFEPKSKIEGVIVTGIFDKAATDIQILKTRVSRFNDPKAIVGIGPGAFADHTAIETVTLSDTVAMIGEGAFEGCTNLKTVELTEAVWLLDQNAFSGCTSLETIGYPGTMAQFEEIQRGDHWAPVEQTFTIVCADGSLTVDDAGNVVPAAEETEGAKNTDSENVVSVAEDTEDAKNTVSENVVPAVEETEGAENTDSGSAAESLSTQERPTLEEFSWYEEVSVNGFWDDAVPLRTTEQVLGGWKGFVVRDPDRERDSYSQELVNVDISVDGSEAIFMVDSYKIYFDGESYDRSGEDAMRFTGDYFNQEFYVIGPGSISVGFFYEYQGHQYAMGEMVDPDGVTADFCLMR